MIPSIQVKISSTSKSGDKSDGVRGWDELKISGAESENPGAVKDFVSLFLVLNVRVKTG